MEIEDGRLPREDDRISRKSSPAALCYCEEAGKGRLDAGESFSVRVTLPARGSNPDLPLEPWLDRDDAGEQQSSRENARM